MSYLLTNKKSFLININKIKYELILAFKTDTINFTIIENDNKDIFYENTYDLYTIQNILDLSNKNSCFDGIVKLYDKAIINKDLSLILKNEKMLIRIKRIVDYEENIYDIELYKTIKNKEIITSELLSDLNLLKNDFQKLLNENKILKEDIKNLKNEMNILCTYKEESEKKLEIMEQKLKKLLIYNSNNIQKDIKNNSPENLSYKYDVIINNQNNYLCIFDVFISLNDKIEYLAYGNKITNNIDIMNLRNNTLSKLLIGHIRGIRTLKYFLNETFQKDYLISSDKNQIIIIWDISSNYNILHKINTEYFGNICSTLLLFSINNNDYILTSSAHNNEHTRIYSFKEGNFIKNIKNTEKNQTLNLIHWIYNNKNYIIELCANKISINNLLNDENYAELIAEPESFHQSGFIYKENYLYCSSEKGFIRIWDLKNKIFTNSIQVQGCVYGIILWSNEYLISANYTNNSLDIVDIEKCKVINQIKTTHEESGKVCFLKKIHHSNYGKCLLSSGDNTIKIYW